MERVGISIAGIVQGVGFRPFVYNLARRYELGGRVWNDATGVRIEVEGQEAGVGAFIGSLEREAPPLAVIDRLTVTALPPVGESHFVITASSFGSGPTALVSPDVATCSECRQEVGDPLNRRYGYGFTNCTNCGPRLSIIEGIPYDRSRTTMSQFPMCPACQSEFTDPANRRFHAQPNACPVCGPSYSLVDSQGDLMPGEPLSQARQMILAGDIVAIKGIGGYHLVCDATNQQAVRSLRQRKIREDKPFAVMFGSLAAVKSQCQLSSQEEKLLTGTVRPIVLLAKSADYSLAEAVAPNNPDVGVLLPYAPIHDLLLTAADVWVMTSGNTSAEPLAYQEEDALIRLASIADAFLVHNRIIQHQIDDSVVRIFRDEPYVLRRGRGLAPAPFRLGKSGLPVLACGSELKNTFCLTRDDLAFVSSHNGDLENMVTYQSYVAAIEHYQQLFAICPQLVAYDLHPGYLSTKYAQELALPQMGIQHHHAHIAGVLAEHKVGEKVIGVVFDGTGYGTDGTLWGGEFLLADCREFQRLAHCRCQPLPGGAKAIREPWRLAAWMLYELYGQELVTKNIPFVRQLPVGWELAMTAAEKGLNSPLSSGAGRLFDTASALLGICGYIHYEGQAAVELELTAANRKGPIFPYNVTEVGLPQLDFRPTFAAMAEGIEAGVDRQTLAAGFHTTLADAIAYMTCRLGQATGINKVALSGGVFQNRTLLTQVVELLESRFTLLLPRLNPPNDGGVSLGQAVIARERSR
jgi:hydrogenase maturation protein HypF